MRQYLYRRPLNLAVLFAFPPPVPQQQSRSVFSSTYIACRPNTVIVVNTNCYIYNENITTSFFSYSSLRLQSVVPLVNKLAAIGLKYRAQQKVYEMHIWLLHN